MDVVFLDGWRGIFFAIGAEICGFVSRISIAGRFGFVTWQAGQRVGVLERRQILDR